MGVCSEFEWKPTNERVALTLAQHNTWHTISWHILWQRWLDGLPSWNYKEYYALKHCTACSMKRLRTDSRKNLPRENHSNNQKIPCVSLHAASTTFRQANDAVLPKPPSLAVGTFELAYIDPIFHAFGDGIPCLSLRSINAINSFHKSVPINFWIG